jgi:hypothetical protein
MLHPFVEQLHFTRSEFWRALEGMNDADARKRFMPMNCISWNIGHLAWQEQRYFVTYAQDKILLPELNQQFAYGAPACTPPLADVQTAWQTVTQAADTWLESITTESLFQDYTHPSGAWSTSFGNLLQRVIYHYWYHIGECMAIRQILGHADLEDFVGNVDNEAPYRTA